MDRKVLIIIIVAVVIVILGSTIAVIAFSGGEKKKTVQMPQLSSFPDEGIVLTVSQADIREGAPVMFPLGAPGSNVTLIYSVKADIRWTDDEQAPAYRPLYQNEPDTFYLAVYSMKAGGETDPNATMNSSSSSSTGSVSVMLNPTPTPGYAMGGGGSNWSVPTSGSADAGSNCTLYVTVSVVPGDITSSRPALLMYNDFGDVIDMTITIRYKSVPLDVYDYYFGPQAQTGTAI